MTPPKKKGSEFFKYAVVIPYRDYTLSLMVCLKLVCFLIPYYYCLSVFTPHTSSSFPSQSLTSSFWTFFLTFNIFTVLKFKSCSVPFIQFDIQHLLNHLAIASGFIKTYAFVFQWQFTVEPGFFTFLAGLEHDPLPRAVLSVKTSNDL